MAKDPSVYPETAKEALEKWDAGDSVWSLEMGGIGPGYEQVIQVFTFELIRYGLKNPPPDYGSKGLENWGEKEGYRINDKFELQMSGAQGGAGKWLAVKTLKDGWRHVLKAQDEQDKSDRTILVSKHWPGKKP